MIPNKLPTEQKAKVDNQNEYVNLYNNTINTVGRTFTILAFRNKEDVVIQPFTTTIIESDVIVLKRSNCSIKCNVEIMAKTEMRLFPQTLNKAEMGGNDDLEYLKIEVLNLSKNKVYILPKDTQIGYITTGLEELS